MEIKIKSHHESLAEAVCAANIDLSYNEDLAKRDLLAIAPHVSRAFVSEDNKVFFIYSADINLLHKYEPFSSCLDDSPFRPAFVSGDVIVVVDSVQIPKTPAGREYFKNPTSVSLGFLAF